MEMALKFRMLHVEENAKTDFFGGGEVNKKETLAFSF